MGYRCQPTYDQERGLGRRHSRGHGPGVRVGSGCGRSSGRAAAACEAAAGQQQMMAQSTPADLHLKRRRVLASASLAFAWWRRALAALYVCEASREEMC
jgi:hypothetical protein